MASSASMESTKASEATLPAAPTGGAGVGAVLDSSAKPAADSASRADAPAGTTASTGSAGHEAAAEAGVSGGETAADSPARKGVVVLAIGMAGAGKTSLVQRVNAECLMRGLAPYLINLDPAVARTPYSANIDIRDTVDYKEVQREYGLGPNGAIITALNLFSTRFDQVLQLLGDRMPAVDFCVVDTPGQIEVFTWSASGTIVTDALAASFPTVLLYVADTPRCSSPVTFMSNMLYACSIMYKTRLPLVIAFNKTDVSPPDAQLSWMEDFEAFQQALDEASSRSDSYIFSLARSLNLALDEFYSNIRAVGVSAGTGEGMGELFAALADAAHEYAEGYGRERSAHAAKAAGGAAAAAAVGEEAAGAPGAGAGAGSGSASGAASGTSGAAAASASGAASGVTKPRIGADAAAAAAALLAAAGGRPAAASATAAKPSAAAAGRPGDGAVGPAAEGPGAAKASLHSRGLAAAARPGAE